ncbi:MAG TPA: SMP-30/gluconolactonase/LRE family protein [Acidimicrobiales bacterium]|jgi:gluconolactonase|nr:SMP-30/gluconolactonase/LRE family protein [Acidimicrobiales bacterium]
MKRLAGSFGLLEAARWYPGPGLVFSDMTRGGIFSMSSTSVEPSVLFPHRKGVGGLVRHADGGYVVAGRNVAHKSTEPGAPTTELLRTNLREQFFNDLTADARGRLFVGSVGLDPSPGDDRVPGSLYCLDLQGDVMILADDVLMSNGLGVDPQDEFLYHVDTNRKLVLRYPIGGRSLAGDREVFVDTSPYGGRPDGLAVGGDGSIWVALAGGGLVVGWDAQGHLRGEIDVPHELVTSLCFGESDYRTMFILTGENEDHPDPAGGCVYRRDAEVTGFPSGVARVPTTDSVRTT